MAKKLYWTKLWDIKGTVQNFIKNPGGIQHSIKSFKIYVNDNDYFDVEFPAFNIEDNKLSNDYRENTYLAALLAAYITTYTCGISSEHFTYNDKTSKIITSIARYHLYYHMSKFIRQPSRMSRYITQEMLSLITKNKPIKTIWKDAFLQGREEINYWYKQIKDKTKVRNQRYRLRHRKEVVGIAYEKAVGTTIVGLDDYKNFIATTSNGLTKTGQRLLQQSIESYVYCVLGAQIKTRWSIVAQGAKSLQTQDVFLKLVKDTFIQDDPTVSISNMRSAIKNANVVLNMAISPGLILIPFNMILLNKMVIGYNNVLTLVQSGMTFGKNSEVNYFNVVEDNNPSPTPVINNNEKETTIVSNDVQKNQSEIYLFVITLVSGVLFSRFT